MFVVFIATTMRICLTRPAILLTPTSRVLDRLVKLGMASMKTKIKTTIVIGSAVCYPRYRGLPFLVPNRGRPGPEEDMAGAEPSLPPPCAGTKEAPGPRGKRMVP